MRSWSEVRCLAAITAIVFLALLREAIAQSAIPKSQYQSRFSYQGVGENSSLTVVHRDPLGKPCLTYAGSSRSHLINPNVYDNIVTIHNQCSKTVKLQLCYYGSQNCVEVELLGGQRKDAILGVYPNSQVFRFSYKEKP
jgi:hypothetical protein